MIYQNDVEKLAPKLVGTGFKHQSNYDTKYREVNDWGYYAPETDFKTNCTPIVAKNVQNPRSRARIRASLCKNHISGNYEFVSYREMRVSLPK